MCGLSEKSINWNPLSSLVFIKILSKAINVHAIQDSFCASTKTIPLGKEFYWHITKNAAGDIGAISETVS